jgi:hypothetical protein
VLAGATGRAAVGGAVSGAARAEAGAAGTGRAVHVAEGYPIRAAVRTIGATVGAAVRTAVSATTSATVSTTVRTTARAAVGATVRATVVLAGHAAGAPVRRTFQGISRALAHPSASWRLVGSAEADPGPRGARLRRRAHAYCTGVTHR